MTNGEKIQTILDVDTYCTEVHGENGIMTFSVSQDWWNTEYKESSSKEKVINIAEEFNEWLEDMTEKYGWDKDNVQALIKQFLM